MTCRHHHGDMVAEIGIWVCGECYAKLAERPIEYGMAAPTNGSKGQIKGLSQVIVWLATFRRVRGVSLSDFLRTMALRFQFKARGMTSAEAYNYAIAALEMLAVEFGDPAYDWSHAAAREMADEEMTQWEPAHCGNS